jgi:hypothetical protein
MSGPEEQAHEASPTQPAAAPKRARRHLIPDSKRGRLALAAILLASLAAAVMLQNWSDNQSSHYDLIRALDAGRETIDAGPYQTKDKAEYKGHLYSARAPGLAIFSVPFYEGLTAIDAPRLARSSEALRGEDELVDFIGWWGAVLPGLILMLLLWRVAEAFEPGYGAAAAVTAGLGTLLLPFSTLLFSHVFGAMLGFLAFTILLRERAGPPRLALVGAAGLALGYALSSEYPLAFAAVVLGLYTLSRRDTLRPGPIAMRAGALLLGALIGIIPLLLYNHAAFGSWTHIAYANIKQQQQGFFGISTPRPKVLVTLLFDSRGMLTISPVLILGAVGTWLLYRRGKRAEALVIGAISLIYLIYNSGYYLPFGGGSPGPRFMITMVPFLACPLGIAFKRYPGPTIALAAVSITTICVATITHPLVGYENETVIWARLLSKAEFQPTIASALGLGRGWGAIWPFFLAAGGAVVLAAAAIPRLALSPRQMGAGVLALLAWGLFAALGPTILGIDHQGLLSIRGAGDMTALNLTLHDGARYPLDRLVIYAVLAGLAALAAMWTLRREDPSRAGDQASAEPRPTQVLSTG